MCVRASRQHVRFPRVCTNAHTCDAAGKFFRGPVGRGSYSQGANRNVASFSLFSLFFFSFFLPWKSNNEPPPSVYFCPGRRLENENVVRTTTTRTTTIRIPLLEPTVNLFITARVVYALETRNEYFMSRRDCTRRCSRIRRGTRCTCKNSTRL